MSRFLPKKLALLAAATVLAAVLGELLFRGWLAARGDAYHGWTTERELARLSDPVGTLMPGGAGEGDDSGAESAWVLHPFAGAESRHDTGDVLRILRESSSPRAYHVLLVGGSVAAVLAGTVGELVERGLEADPRFAGRDVRLLEYAHPAYKQPQQLMRVAYLFSLGYRPDAVVNLDGFNELALVFESLGRRINPVFPAYVVWGNVLDGFAPSDGAALELLARDRALRDEIRGLAAAVLDYRLANSSVLGTLAVHRARRLVAERVVLRREIAAARAPARGDEPNRSVCGPDFDPAPAAVFHACLENWFESSLSLHALCAARGIPYLHVLQPTLHDDGSKPLSAEERALPPAPAGWAESARFGYPLLRARGAELSARGVWFLDASRIFAAVEETLYYDDCHFLEPGNRILAEALVAELLRGLP